jgi:hypothetical protein
MKLANTNLNLDSMIFFAFAPLCDVPNLAHVAATQNSAYVRGYCGVTVFMAIATFWVLASLRKQAQLSESVKPQPLNR